MMAYALATLLIISSATALWTWFTEKYGAAAALFLIAGCVSVAAVAPVATSPQGLALAATVVGVFIFATYRAGFRWFMPG